MKCAPVQPVGQAQKDISRFTVPFFQKSLHLIKDTGISGFIPLNQHPCRFIHSDNVVVFVENLRGNHDGVVYRLISGGARGQLKGQNSESPK